MEVETKKIFTFSLDEKEQELMLLLMERMDRDNIQEMFDEEESEWDAMDTLFGGIYDNLTTEV